MTERDGSNSPERPQDLELAIELSNTFLNGIQPRVGRGYDPIKVPMSWLIRKFGAGVVIGHRVKDAALMPQPWILATDSQTQEMELRLHNLRTYGLIRDRVKTIPIGNWLGQLDLTELREAQLIDRKLTPVSDERVFDLKIHGYDSEGRNLSPVPSERIVYSTESGLLLHQRDLERVESSATEGYDRIVQHLARAAS